MKCTIITLGGILVVAGSAPAQVPFVTFSASGADAAAIQTAVDDFRDALGTNNGAAAGTLGSGRREINWDAVPDADAAAGRFPDDFFNIISTRGAVFSLVDGGRGFQVSADAANPAATGIEFDNLNATYSTAFSVFSADRLFTALGTNVHEVRFLVSGSSSPAATRGFGAVFTDVDSDTSTTIEFFRGKEPLGLFAVPSFGGNGGLSFLGVDFMDSIVTDVRITSGSAAPGVDDVTQGGTEDIVVMDDFIYGEPVAIVPTLDGVRGSLTALTELVETAAAADAKLLTKLTRSLGQASKRLDKAVAKDDAEEVKAVEAELRSAIRRLNVFERTLDAKSAGAALDAATRLELAQFSAAIGVDLATLVNGS